MALEVAGEGSRGRMVHTIGAPHCTQYVLHDLRKGPQTWKTGEKKVTEVILKSFNEPNFFGDKYVIGTAETVGHY